MIHLRVAGGIDWRIRRDGPASLEPERPPEVSSRPLHQRRSIRPGPELGSSYPSRPSRRLRSNLPCGGRECREEEESSPPQCDGGNVDAFENGWNGCGGLGWEDPSRNYNKL